MSVCSRSQEVVKSPSEQTTSLPSLGVGYLIHFENVTFLLKTCKFDD